uniref:Uncharacterized protein n=1 Tax=Arundo donax TaxID=35708 RepID=A0A0A8YT02_ARUDO
MGCGPVAPPKKNQQRRRWKKRWQLQPSIPSRLCSKGSTQIKRDFQKHRHKKGRNLKIQGQSKSGRHHKSEQLKTESSKMTREIALGVRR